MKLLIAITLIYTASFHAAAQSDYEICDRSQEMIKFLEHKIEKPCSEITKEDIGQIQQLFYSSETPLALNSFHINDLTHFYSASYAWLHFNWNPAIIPDTYFQHMTGLKHLTLSSAKATKHPLPADFFNKLTELEYLALVIGFSDGAFSKLTRLKELGLGLRTSVNWSKETFKGLENLQKLRISQTYNADFETPIHIPADLFTPLSALESLRIYNARKNIYLDSLNLSSTPLIHLTDLEIEGASVNLTDHFFANTPNLKHINISPESPLSVISSKTFQPLKNLERISLSNTSVTHLALETFDNLTKLKSLFFASCNFKEFPVRLLRDQKQSLERLTFFRCPHLTNEMMEDLKRAYPHIEIDLDN